MAVIADHLSAEKQMLLWVMAEVEEKVADGGRLILSKNSLENGK